MTKFKTGDRVIANNGHTGTIDDADGLVYVAWDAGQGANTSFFYFNQDGTKSCDVGHGPYRSISLLRDTPATIDWTKPVQTVCGKEVTIRSHNTTWGGAEIRIEGRDSTRSYNRFGKHRFNTQPDVINVSAVPSVDWTKPLQTRAGDPVTVIGTLQDGRRVVEVRQLFNGTTTRVVPAVIPVTRFVESADDIVNKPDPITTVFLNVYADGSVGSAQHKTLSAASFGSKYDKVRVGILMQEKTASGAIVKASMTATNPQLRTRSNPSGINPFA